MDKKERYATDPEYREKRKAVAREWYFRNKGKAQKAKREYRAALPEEKKAARTLYMKEYVSKNVAVLKEKRKEYYSKPDVKARRTMYESTEAYLVSRMLSGAKQRASLNNIKSY